MAITTTRSLATEDIVVPETSAVGCNMAWFRGTGEADYAYLVSLGAASES